MPSSKRKSDQLKQSNRQAAEDELPKQAPKSILEHLQADTDDAQQDDELVRADKYAERTNKIHPVNLSRTPPSPYIGASRSPPVHHSNGANVHVNNWTSTAASPFTRAEAYRQAGLSPPHGYGGRAIAVGHGQTASSPPTAFGGRLLSLPKSVPSFSGQSPPNRDIYTSSRRASMFSQYGHGQAAFAGRVPLPHEDQAHFYGAPQLDFGPVRLNKTTEKMTPGDRGYFCGFDTLDGTGDAESTDTDNVVICGYEGGLEVYHVQHDGAQLIGMLEGLCGSVLGAKLLPWTSLEDPLASYRPMIAVTLHGPNLEDGSEQDGDGSNEQAIEDSPQVRPRMSRSEELITRTTSYQTKVQVYSLATQQLVSTLYTAPAIPLITPLDDPDFVPPSPTPITVDARGRFVVVAVGGRSGEVYLYAPSDSNGVATREPFRCLGKLWTSLHAAKARKDAGTGSGTIHQIDSYAEQDSTPILSLGHRWLALVPPQTSAQVSLYGTIGDQAHDGQAPGVTVSISPSPPAMTCAVDTPDDRFVSRLSRLAAKNIAKGAKWANDYGKQLWKQYMGQPSTSLGPDGRTQTHSADAYQQFPPTHAAVDMPRTSDDASVVALYDLDRLLVTTDKRMRDALSPVAVFEQALGCDYLSFSPSGLFLLTVSKQGDTQVLWDLKRMNHARNVALGLRNASFVGPHVREVTRFTRVTDASVVDVVWGGPKDDKLAVLTDKGTLHVHLVDANVLQWPPIQRQSRQLQHPPAQNTSTPSSKHTSPDPPSPSARSRLNSAYGAVNGATAWLSSMRSRSSSNGAGLPLISGLSLAPAAGAKSAKAVAASAGKAIGQGVHDIRHAADNKIYLRSSTLVGPRRAQWMTGESRGFISVVANGTVKMFKMRIVTDAAHGKRGQPSRRVLVKAIQEIRLQGLPDHRFAPALFDTSNLFNGNNAVDGKHNLDSKKSQGMWQPRSSRTASSRPRDDRRSSERSMWKSYAELQTMSPYAKFHTDPRVSLFVYTDEPRDTASSFNLDSDSNADENPHPFPATGPINHFIPRVFGDDVPVRKISTGTTRPNNAGVIAGESDADGLVWRSVRQGEDDGDGFFEEDADVIDFASDRV